MSTYSFYIGTHAPASKTCIYRCEADFENLAFSTLSTMQGIPDPTYLAGPANDVLYALGKTPEGGAVYALRQESGADRTDGAGSGSASGLGAE